MVLKPGYNGLRWFNPIPHKTSLGKLFPSLPPDVLVRRKALRKNSNQLKGPEGRLQLYAKDVTRLVKYERIELSHHFAEEVRTHVETLIIEAIRYGDCHRPTMQLADFWLNEKQLIHKLFKVLVPRYIDSTESFTSLHRLGPDYSVYLKYFPRFPLARLPKELSVLELKGNPLPPIHRRAVHSEKWLTNVLLKSAKEDYEHNNK